MIRSRQLTSSLTRTLEVKAEQAMTAYAGAADAPMFDRTRGSSAVSELAEQTGLLDDAHEIPGRSRRRATAHRLPTKRRRLLVAAASIVALAVLGAAVIARQGGSNHERARTVTVGDPPNGWLVPTWVPEGTELWGVEWDSGQPQFSEPGTAPQLFGDPAGGRAIYITSFRYELHPDGTEPVTVRGQAGRAGRGWDVEEADMGDAIAWDERGATITALYNGMSRAQAIAALGSLEWRSDDPVDGFAPPTDSSLPLRGEVSTRQHVSRAVTLLYSQGPPASSTATGRLGLEIHTSTSSGISAEYLEEWYQQGSEARDGQGPLSRYEPDRHALTVLWPDGRSISISPTGVSPSELPSREILERIADSVTVATEADLADQRDMADANIVALPVLQSAETSIGTVEIHGDSHFLRLCLRDPSGQGPTCMTGTFGGGAIDDETAVATAEWTINGVWYVAVASKGDQPQIVGGHDRTAPDAGQLPAQTSTAGEWTIRLVQPAPDIDLVCTNSQGTISCNHHRPD
jgi:hypothetical protein